MTILRSRGEFGAWAPLGYQRLVAARQEISVPSTQVTQAPPTLTVPQAATSSETRPLRPTH